MESSSAPGPEPRLELAADAAHELPLGEVWGSNY